MERYTVWAFMKNDIREDVRKKFRGDEGSGYSFVFKKFDISWARWRKNLAFDLAKRIKRAFPKIAVDVCDRNGKVIMHNGKLK